MVARYGDIIRTGISPELISPVSSFLGSPIRRSRYLMQRSTYFACCVIDIILEIVVRIVHVSDFSNDRLVSVHGAYKGTTIAFWQLTLPLESFGPDVHLLGCAGRMRA